jgi:formylglycine-generating enzyme required for sulfatase activity
MMGAFLAVAVAAGLIIWGQISKQHAIEQANLEKQRKEIEEQRLSLENAQKDLVAQLADAKKAAEARKAEEAKPEKKGVVAKVEEPAAPKVGPSAEEQRVKDLEERLQRVREQQEAAERRKADLEARKAEKTAKAEERRARLEEERAKAEERRAAEAEAASKAAEEKKRKDEAAQAAAAALAAKEAEPKCPKGMATVAAGPFQFGSAAGDPMHVFGDKNNDPVDTNAFCIDYYEFPNKAGARPKAGVSFAAAAQMCKKARKRLCSEAEWEKACKGPGNLRYPYGNTFDPAACITEDDQGNRREGGPAGSSKSCRSGYGVMDMSGNVSEWVLGEGGKSLLKGGSADKPSHAVRCAAKVPAPAAKTAPTIGFRCCADAN